MEEAQTALIHHHFIYIRVLLHLSPTTPENDRERCYNDDEAFSTINDYMVMRWGMRKINLCIITHTLFCALLFTKFSTYHAWKRSNNYKQLCDEFSLSFVITPCITMCDIISSHEWRKCVKIGVKSIIIVSCVFLFTYFYCSNRSEKFSSSLSSSHNELTFFWEL